MATEVADAKSRTPLVRVMDSDGMAFMPLHQGMSRVGHDSFIQIDINPAVATTALSNGDTVNFDMEPNDAFNIKNLIVKLQLTFAGTVQTVPGPYLFDRIRIIANKGNGDTLQTIYPEQMVWHLAQMDTGEKEHWEEKAQVRWGDTWKHRILRPPKQHVSGDVVDVYLPLPISFWNMDAIHLQHISEEIRFRMEFNSDFAVSGTATNVTVTGLSFQIRQDELTDSENNAWVDAQQSMSHMYNYLDVVRLDYNDKTATISTETKYDLQNFTGKVPFLMIVHKLADSPAASTGTLYTYANIGDAATFDLKSPNNQSLLGKGNAIKADYLEHQYVLHARQKAVKGMYILQFCDSLQKAVAGAIDNYFQFIGDREQLSIVYGPQNVGEVHTVTTTNADNDGGVGGQVGYAGHFSDAHAHDATAAAVEADLDALEPLDRRGYTTTVTAVPFGAASTTKTITFNVQDGKVSDNIGLPHWNCSQLTDGGTADVFVSSALTTPGSNGWTTSSSYQISIFAYYYKRVAILPNGRLRCWTL